MPEITITSANFDREVLESKIPVLVDFWASWCGPCRKIGPLVSEIASEFDGKVKVGKVNVDEEQSLAVKYNVMTIPTLIVFKDGEIAETASGLRGKQDIIGMLGAAD